MYRELLQYEVELKYGKKHIRDKVLVDILDNEVLIDKLSKCITDYRSKEYGYKSKVDRVRNLTPYSREIAIEVIVAVLTVQPIINPIQVVISILLPVLDYDNIVDGIKTAAEVLAVCEDIGLYTIYHHTSDESDLDTLGIQANYELDGSVRESIDKTKFLPPMVCKPIPWTGNQSGGNLTGSGSVLLQAINNHNEYQCLDTLNILQEIPWELNKRMLEFMEQSKKDLDTQEKKSNFNRWINSNEEVYRELLDQDNEFYFVWKYDFRGRSYSQGYNVNIQANSYGKSVIQFKNKELITDEVLV